MKLKHFRVTYTPAAGSSDPPFTLRVKAEDATGAACKAIYARLPKDRRLPGEASEIYRIAPERFAVKEVE